MIRLTFALAALLPATASAGDGVPDLKFTIGAGFAAAPAYYGSDDYELGPTGSLTLGYLDTGGFRFGTLEGGEARGVSVRAAFRYLPDRKASDHPELSGLDDIDASYELGLGLSYLQRDYEVFANLRYGFGGHEAFVGTIGSDAIFRPSDRLTLRAGPRIEIGSSDFNQTYFGVTSDEALASSFPAFNADAGIYAVGLDLSAVYDVTPVWSVGAGVGYQHLVGDASDSPITGNDDRFTAHLMVRREISFDWR